MRKLIIMIILFLCFYNAAAFADISVGSSTNNTASTSTDFHPIAGIINGIEKLDGWIQQNLW